MAKSLRNRINQVKNKIGKTEIWTISLSIVATIIALVSLYFQFFYRSNELYVSFIRGELQNDTTIVVHLVFSNKGNQTETIIANDLYLEKVEGYSIPLFRFNSQHSFYDTDPIILKPGDQVFKEIKADIRVNASSQPEFNVNPNDTLVLFVETHFLNKKAEIVSNETQLGWGVGNSSRKFSKMRAFYVAKKLKGGSPITGMLPCDVLLNCDDKIK